MDYLQSISSGLRHFWHAVSNVRPIYWLLLYLGVVPVFALIYYWLPRDQFHLVEGATGAYGDWLYYSIVTITTLGFGDFTPALTAARVFTAIEVMCGLLVCGFFLNAVGSMKSENDVDAALARQRRLHFDAEREKLVKSVPMILHQLNQFLAYCYAVTTPLSERDTKTDYNPDFTIDDMKDMALPSGLPSDRSGRPAVRGLMMSASSVSLMLDTMQAKVDMMLWPGLLDDCFAFVAAYQMLSLTHNEATPDAELVNFIRTSAAAAMKIETLVTSVATNGNAPTSVTV